MFMNTKSTSINALFIKKMAYSAVIQFVIFSCLVVSYKDHLTNTQMHAISKELLITDTFTTEEIGRYALLKNQSALDLALLNLESERKLDSVKFEHRLKEKRGVKCRSISGLDKFICKGKNDTYWGITRIKEEDDLIGYVIAKKQYNSIFSIASSWWLFFILAIVFVVFLFNSLFLFLFLRKYLARSTKQLLQFISSKSHRADTSNIINFKINEYNQIADRFAIEHSRVLKLQDERAFFEARKIISDQVAHDIRSPLAAINAVLSTITTLDDKRKVLMQNAVTRINDIANNILLNSHQANNDSLSCVSDEEIDFESIFLLLNSIVSEKKYEYYEEQITIHLMVESHCYSSFVRLNRTSFTRVISNLINNSVESFAAKGQIDIVVSCHAQGIQISIEDNGCGIAPELIPKIMERGFSSKTNGSGLGLSYAKDTIEQLHGEMYIHSSLGEGTCLSIVLPCAAPPLWFCNQLIIRENAILVIVDNDSAMYDLWKEKVSNLNITVYYFANPNELSKNIDKLKGHGIFLIDYEFSETAMTGLDIIHNLKLYHQSTLVTNNYNDKQLRNSCELLGLKILPKPYLPMLSIVLEKVVV